MKKHVSYITALILIAVLVAALLVGGIVAKYIMAETLQSKVTFSADLAKSVKLIEHKAARGSDGAYTLDTSKEVNGNEYYVMPGVDIPKDPRVIITDKSAVDAYLYIEIVKNNIPQTVNCNVSSSWTLLKDVTGPNGGDVYVYSRDGVPFILNDKSENISDIPIIENNKITVSDKFDEADKEFSIDFYGYMTQVRGDKDAELIFQSSFITNTSEGGSN